MPCPVRHLDPQSVDRDLVAGRAQLALHVRQRRPGAHLQALLRAVAQVPSGLVVVGEGGEGAAWGGVEVHEPQTRRVGPGFDPWAGLPRQRWGE
ncbi:MAG: hypothetical protein ACRYG8_36120 [Janthinobacterium lividum]